MKTFTLTCDQGHEFELMVKSADALEDQQRRGFVTCPYCGTAKCERALSRPAVIGGKDRGKSIMPPSIPPSPPPPQPTTPAAPAMAAASPAPSRSEIEQAYRFFSEMRTKVEKTHDNVGPKFSAEVRAMHYGEKEERGVYGEASVQDVQELLEEGIEILPLPDLPKSNA